ncbi:hypothetical protein [uncultured Amphritea sp.]|uniref:hypothetical protein n=1 Tax=uncultured Amphritea sp. TaxID=981605 RepID=UPI0025E4EE1D|nr:hypothetical protein [uncultured Amphritea sp.]
MEYQCHFDPYNRVFTHISERVINPRKPGEFLPVMFATPDPLPELGENQTARRKDDDSGWELIEDFRGAVYWLADGSQHQITDFGVSLPVGALSEPPEAPAADRRLTAKNNIDSAAGEARYRFVSSGQLIEEEYRLTLQQTKEWRAAGSPADAVPFGMQSWMDAAGITAEDAALDIEQTANGWEAALLSIRQLRLAGKASVDASGDTADFDAVAQVYIDQLKTIKP